MFEVGDKAIIQKDESSGIAGFIGKEVTIICKRRNSTIHNNCDLGKIVDGYTVRINGQSCGNLWVAESDLEAPTREKKIEAKKKEIEKLNKQLDKERKELVKLEKYKDRAEEIADLIVKAKHKDAGVSEIAILLREMNPGWDN